MKPTASRSTCSETYLIGLNYKAPAKIDPRLLDYRHLFTETAEPTRKVISFFSFLFSIWGFFFVIIVMFCRLWMCLEDQNRRETVMGKQRRLAIFVYLYLLTFLLTVDYIQV